MGQWAAVVRLGFARIERTKTLSNHSSKG